MSFAMQEPEPLKLKHEYPPLPEGSAHRPHRYATRKNQGNNIGGKPAFDEAERLRIALMPGSSNELEKTLGISAVTICRYRREFREEREAAGVEAQRGRPRKEPTEGTDRAASRPSEVAAGGMPVSEPLAGVETGQGKALEAYLL